MSRRIVSETAFALVCTMLILVFAATPFAAAKDLLVRSCSQATGTNWTTGNPGWYGSYYKPPFPGSTSGSCPAGMSFSTSVSTTKGTEAAWSFSMPWLPIVRHIRFEFEGGDTTTGWRYSVRSCSDISNPCETLDTFPDRNADDPADVWERDLAINGILRIVATCTVAPCAPATPLAFHDVVFTVHDEEPPEAWMMGYGSWSKRINVDYSASLSDDYGGAGLASGTARIGDSPPLLDAFKAGAWDLDQRYRGSEYKPADYPLVLSVSRSGRMLELFDLADGKHQVKFEATDVAGNVMEPKSYTIHLDDTPPSVPEDPVLTGAKKQPLSPHYWTTSPSIGVSWTNRTEPVATDTHSGVRSTSVARYPHGTDVDPGALDGTGGHLTTDSIPSIQLPQDGLWDIFISTIDAAGNRSGALKLVVGRDDGVPAPPVLQELPWLSESALGTQHWTSGSSGTAISGICGYSIDVNSTQDSEPPSKISDEGTITSQRLPAHLAEGMHWFHARAVSCAGRASDVADSPIKIDRTAPTVFLDGVGSGAWSDKSLDVRLTADDELSGVERIGYRIGTDPVRFSNSKSESISIGEGVHELRYFAIDNAGNGSSEQTRTVRVDFTPPQAEFKPRDLLRPTRLEGTVVDGLSGVKMAMFQYRQLGASENSWKSLPTSMQQGHGGERLVSAEIPDATMSDGRYEFRILAIDEAGNATAEGSSATIELPVRETPSLIAKLAKVVSRCVEADGSVRRSRSSRRRCAWKPVVDDGRALQRQTVDFARQVELIGEIRDQRGVPTKARDLKIYEAVDGKNPRFVKTIASDAQGKIRYSVPSGPSRRFIIRSDSDELRMPASAYADLGVALTARLRANKRRVRMGESVRFFGSIESVASEHSPSGLLALIEYYKPGEGWAPAVGRRRIGADGKFATLPYTFRGDLKKPKTVRFRAFVNTKRTGFPFLDGYSGEVSVRILPRR